ncbi:sugar kinase, ribokinase [Planoprotostelium fungivorum]|uniref:Sugar kinase, ribokinase n=1 Tax=Planoprotostelium fungivorum TaxID=1890364 RepID=A0A2P6MVB6_9EUKA|nr:sugar kinase, ribokinase [Planoprotostelium fungivorum]
MEKETKKIQDETVRDLVENPRTPVNIAVINADFEMRVDAQAGSTETLLAHDMMRVSGGKAANRAFIAKKMNLSSKLIGHVGDDDLAAQALDPLSVVGVDISDVQRAPNQKTAVSIIQVNPDGKKSITLASNANDHWSEAGVTGIRHSMELNFSNCNGTCVISIDLEMDPLAIKTAITVAKELKEKNPDRILTGIEAEDEETAAAATALCDRGVMLSCTKMSDGGCVAVQREGEKKKRIHVEKMKIDAIDTTGAGDAFTGYLCVALQRGLESSEAIFFFAVAASHCAVTKYESQQSYPEGEEVEMMMRLRENLHVTDLN